MPKKAIQLKSTDGFIYILDVETGRWGKYSDDVRELPLDIQAQLEMALVDNTKNRKAV